ncbi:hypothetical protein [Aureibaculum luteum]|uniref:hypothetical protein n=1 Tax=Aureibaculum luteum TaxID=1548456 RepID=UPI000E52CD9D|nr:hypothetical protein [Aureibaculum luteum]
MKANKTSYNPNKNLTRGKLSNPFSNATIHSRIQKSGAIDLRNNSKCVEKNGYFEVKIIDRSKKLK